MKTKDIFIDGNKIYLRLPKEKDLRGNWYRWFNDPIITRYQNKGIFPNTLFRQKKYYTFVMNSKSDIVFAIIEKKTQKHIGCVGLHNIDPVHRSAELGIIIGEKKYWGRGYGKSAWNMITDYGFNVLNLYRIAAVVFKENIASRKSADASGFKIEGLMRDIFFKKGRYHSAYLMSVLKGEFRKINA